MRSTIIAVAALVLSGATLYGGPVQWTIASGGNGHYYEGVAATGTWTAARSAAEARGGYLASITSDPENNFVYSLVDRSTHPGLYYYDGWAYLGPYLGGYQPAGGTSAWVWVDSAEPWSYTNWRPGQPDNSGNFEDFLQYMNRDVDGAPAPYWNDIGDNGSMLGYVVEWNADPSGVPEPQTWALVLGAIGGMGWWRAARRRCC